MLNITKLKSENIHVFPTTKRTAADKRSKLLSESNLTNIVNMLLDKDSFVINSDNISVGEVPGDTHAIRFDGKPISFNINGYYFNVNDVAYILTGLYSSFTELKSDAVDGNPSVYANIRKVQVGDYIELYGTDNMVDGSNYYDGVIFSKNQVYNTNLKLFDIIYNADLDENSVYLVIPKESQVKFEGRSIGNLDLGEI